MSQKNIYSSSKNNRRNNQDNFRSIYNQAKKDHSVNKLHYKNNNKRYKYRNKRSIWIKVIIIILVLVLLLVGGAVSAFFYYFGGLNTDKNFTQNPQDLGLVTSSKINNDVTNIALFGLDTRERGARGRSDTTMIATFDGVHKEIKVTSILRDSRVEIEGHGKDKLCHAYAYGGPELAVKTLNKNYNMDIMEYVSVNFTQMAHIIDAVGGLDIEITKEERVAANGLIASTPELSYSEEIPAFSGKSATLHLNGSQAVSYARIRKIDNETKRAGRQQIVLQLLLNKVMDMNVTQYPDFIKTMLSYMDTSLNYQDILGFIPVLMFGKPTLKTYKIPDENDPNVKGGMVNGVWYWVYDLKVYANKLYNFIYNEE